MSQLWKELHERAASFMGTDDRLFVNMWGAKLPRFTQGCSCNEFWKNWVVLNPPVFTYPGAYFEWTIKAHNAVNTKLKKKIWTVSEAREVWPGNRTVIILPAVETPKITAPKPTVVPVPIKPTVSLPTVVPVPIKPTVVPVPIKPTVVPVPIKPTVVPVILPVPIKPTVVPVATVTQVTRGLPRRPFPQRAQKNPISTMPSTWMPQPKEQVAPINRGQQTFKRWTLTPEQMARLEQQKKNAIKKSQ